jgi:parallel beta-helix repeat protein
MDVRFNLIEVKAPNGYPVHNLDTGSNYTTIQTAIDAPETLDGHTIYVEDGIYNENLNISKNISLLGESKEHTIVDGSGATRVILIEYLDNVSIKNFTIRNGEYGIFSFSSSNSSITNSIFANCSYLAILASGTHDYRILNNTMLDCSGGLKVMQNAYDASYGNTVIGNNMTNNQRGIQLEQSSNNVLKGNILANKGYNLELYGGVLLHFLHDIDTSNTVDGKPVYYLVNVSDITVPMDAGYVALVNCTRITAQELGLSKNAEGILLFGTTDSSITNNNITNTGNGIEFFNSSSNDVSGNTISNNSYGMRIADSSNHNTFCANSIEDNDRGIVLEDSSYNDIFENNITGNDADGICLWSSNNMIIHNNFMNNANQVYIDDSVSTFDNGIEGNYWDNYNGTDHNYDGIGDTPYVMDTNNRDNHPLMSMFHSFNTSLGERVNIISNSTIGDFGYFESSSTIRMQVSNSSTIQTHGFCRICIPHELMNTSNITIIIDDGLTEVLRLNDTIYDNGTHRWIYFAYQHSTHEVIIVIELPSFLILPLFMLATLLAVIAYKRRCLV